MNYKTPLSSVLVAALCAIGFSANAQSNTAKLAAQTFVDACIATNGDAQLARLALARQGDFHKKKRPRGLFGEEIGNSSMDSYTHRGGRVTALVAASRVGRDLCAVGVKRPKNLNATNLEIATALAQSHYASNGKIKTQKKGRRTVYIVQMGRFQAIVDKSLAGKNSSINMK